MPVRGSARQRKFRVQTGNTIRDNPTALVVNTPVNEKVRDEGAAAAQSLATFAGVALDFLSQRQVRKDAEGAEQAVEEVVKGLVSEEANSKNQGYLNRREALRAEGHLSVRLPEIEDQLRQANADQMDEAELSKTLNDLVRAAFDPDGGDGTEEEAAYFRALADPLLAFEARILGKHKAFALLEARQSEEADLVRAVNGRYAATNGVYPYDYVEEQVNDMRDGVERNELLLNLAINKAIEEGDPSILENYPDKRADGTATLAGIPEHRSRILSAIAQATNIAIARENKAIAEQTAINKEEARVALIETARQVFMRDSPPDLKALIDLPAMEFSDIGLAQSAWRSHRDDVDSTAGNPEAQTALWALIYTNQAGTSDVMHAYGPDLDILGHGEAGAVMGQRMLAAVEQMNSIAERDDARLIGTHQKDINDAYNANIKGMMHGLNAQMNIIGIEANREYNDRVLVQGQDPTEAHIAVRIKYDAVVDRAGASPIGTGSASSQAAELGVHMDPLVISAAVRGEGQLPPGLTATFLDQLFQVNQLSREDTEKAISMLNNQ